MSEKVSGFRKKDCVEYSGYYNPKLNWTVHEEDLVPVYLKSESVTVKGLEKWIDDNLDACSNIDAVKLLAWAKKEAKKK